MNLKYFAYGSNMSLARLRERVPSARPLGTFQLAAHRLCFHKVSFDGSAKCDARWTGYSEDVVLGVLFDMEPRHKPTLDAAEGLGAGYEEKSVTLVNADGQAQEGFLYYATHVDKELAPYSWYLNHVLTGAREASLPGYYIDLIAAVVARDDPDNERDARERGIHRSGGQRDVGY